MYGSVRMPCHSVVHVPYSGANAPSDYGLGAPEEAFLFPKLNTILLSHLIQKILSLAMIIYMFWVDLTNSQVTFLMTDGLVVTF